jgi:membrane protease YdiL (CAAX protease family)
VLALAALPFVVRWVGGATGPAVYWVQSTYKLLLLAAPLWWRRRRDRLPWAACFWPINEPRPSVGTWMAAAAVAVVLAGSAVAAILALAPLLEIDRVSLRQAFDERFQLTPRWAVGIVAYLFTVNAALEELHYRAWLDRELSRRWGSGAGIAASAAAFAALHLFIFAPMPGVTPLMQTLVFAGLFAGGVCWSLLARRPGGIHAAWLSHGLCDAGLLTWGLFWLGYL